MSSQHGKRQTNVPTLPAGGISGGMSDGRLDSWKEIASYLRRSPRCVQRWEKNLGLPVHRIHHVEGYTVYAYISELDSWRQSRDRIPDSFSSENARDPGTIERGQAAFASQSRSSTSMLELCRTLLKAVPLRFVRS